MPFRGSRGRGGRSTRGSAHRLTTPEASFSRLTPRHHPSQFCPQTNFVPITSSPNTKLREGAGVRQLRLGMAELGEAEAAPGPGGAAAREDPAVAGAPAEPELLRVPPGLSFDAGTVRARRTRTTRRALHAPPPGAPAPKVAAAAGPGGPGGPRPLGEPSTAPGWPPWSSHRSSSTLFPANSANSFRRARRKPGVPRLARRVLAPPPPTPRGPPRLLERRARGAGAFAVPAARRRRRRSRPGEGGRGTDGRGPAFRGFAAAARCR